MTQYNKLSELARLDPRYRGRIFIADTLARDLRAHDGGYNAQLSQLVGAVERRSFEGGNAFDPARWTTDLEHFLAHPGMASLKDRPGISRASAEDVSMLLSQ